MIENMEERGGHRERCRPDHSVRAKGHSQTQADEHDTDIFNRAVGKKTLQIALKHRMQKTKDGGNGAKNQDYDRPLP